MVRKCRLTTEYAVNKFYASGNTGEPCLRTKKIARIKVNIDDASANNVNFVLVSDDAQPTK